jgi:hypothetical protein
MDLISFTSIVVILIIIVGSYLVVTDAVQGRAKIILIVFVAIFGILLLSSLSMFKSYYNLVESPVSAMNTTTINKSKLGDVTERYSISTWIYINDWNTNFGNVKNVVSYARGTDSTGNFEIKLDSNLNDIKIIIPTKNSSSTYSTQEVSIPNISIQKWVNIIVCVDTNNADIYINGKLVQSVPLLNTSATPSSQNDITFGNSTNGFNGSISGARFYNKFLTPQECWTIYTDGFSDSLLGSFMNRYNASLVFYKDQQKTNEFNFM